jgi:uncharacterized membrane protein
MRRPNPPPVGTAHHTTRIEALTDGVFAIVMTLMVFDIRVPQAPPEQLWSELVNLWPSFLAYAISFVQLGIYWIGHRNQYNFISKEDHTIRWITLLFLALVAFIPFSTQLISNYPTHRVALLVYGINLIVIGLVLYWHWHYATSERRLVDPNLSPAVVYIGVRRCLMAPAAYAVACLTSLSPLPIILELYALIPLLYLFPGIVERLWPVPARLLDKEANAQQE